MTLYRLITRLNSNYNINILLLDIDIILLKIVKNKYSLFLI